MSPHPIFHEGKDWKTAEALFQALRFDDDAIREEIRAAVAPIGAKLIAKQNADKMVIDQRGEQDVENMRLCLKLKVEQNPEVKELLLASGNDFIVEDTTKRKDLFWGAKWDNGGWVGHNKLGELWMELRKELNVDPSGV